MWKLFKVDVQYTKLNRNTKRCSGVFIVDCDMLLWCIILAEFEHVNGRWNTLLPWSKSMHFRVGSRNPATIMTKFYATAVNNSFQPLPNFCHKELHLRCCIGLKLNIVTWYAKFLREHTSPIFLLSFLGLISNGLNGDNINSLTWNVAFL